MTDRPRPRDIGIDPWSHDPGEDNALTDVPDVRVGHVTLSEDREIDGESRSIRTGVTAIRPGENLYEEPVTGATHVINGYGKAVGFPQVEEFGEIETPILLTNTLNTWRVADALASWVMERQPEVTMNPLVGECNDGRLSDIRGRHVTAEHVREALESATEPNAAGGAIGAGTGTTGFGWKGGIGTASRLVDCDGETVTVGTLVQTNTGSREDLRIADTAIGTQLPDEETVAESDAGSIMMIVGTDAPLTSRQLQRVTKRTALGLGRVGGVASNGSGDFGVGFSVAEPGDVPDGALTPLFRATVEATEEAILDSLFRAETTENVDGETVPGIPIDAVRDALDA